MKRLFSGRNFLGRLFGGRLFGGQATTPPTGGIGRAFYVVQTRKPRTYTHDAVVALELGTLFSKSRVFAHAPAIALGLSSGTTSRFEASPSVLRYVEDALLVSMLIAGIEPEDAIFAARIQGEALRSVPELRSVLDRRGQFAKDIGERLAKMNTPA